jgi:hypothetical protein
MHCFNRRSTIALVASLLVGSGSAAFAQAGNLGSTDKPLYLNQAWSSAERNWFYATSQGSQIMPYDWFMALEQGDSELAFRDSLQRFGYLPNPSKFNNPDGLPVGFVKDADDRGDWVGLTCAACHTNQVNFAGHTLQIDGGPTNADMFALIAGIAQSLAATSASMSDPKFKRFADRVLKKVHTPNDEKTLFDSLKEFSAEFSTYVKNSTADVPWGKARLDAFGMIFNRATSIDLNIPTNSKQPNAPVSYPFLWDTHWHNVVQWNGSAPNQLSIERLGRNVGEVVGVFAHTDIKKTIMPPLFFKTSAKRLNQLMLEELLSKLRSPVWPAQWAPIDKAKAAAGRKLYQVYCDGCHTITPRNKPITATRVTMTPISLVGTDSTMATNAADRKSTTGFLEGVRMPFFVEPLPKEVTSLELTAKIVVGAILAPPDWDETQGELSAEQLKLLKSIKTGQPRTDGLRTMLSSAKSNLERGNTKDFLQSVADYVEKNKKANEGLAYKARPLDGIWATAPYLHNGSVPNLYQLLLPSAQRVKQFYVGSREFDSVNVGFKFDGASDASLFDTTLPGNSNAGHEGSAYGTDKLTDQQRWELVEYLKTL